MNDESISISNLGSTKMMCRDMRIEDSFLQYLANAQEIKIDDAELNLYDANGVFVSFKPTPFE